MVETDVISVGLLDHTIVNDEIGCKLALITNRKSHTGFQLVKTLNDLERCNIHYLASFYQMPQFWGQLCLSG